VTLERGSPTDEQTAGDNRVADRYHFLQVSGCGGHWRRNRPLTSSGLPGHTAQQDSAAMPARRGAGQPPAIARSLAD
jgi:hypothetical protein